MSRPFYLYEESTKFVQTNNNTYYRTVQPHTIIRVCQYCWKCILVTAVSGPL